MIAAGCLAWRQCEKKCDPVKGHTSRRARCDVARRSVTSGGLEKPSFSPGRTDKSPHRHSRVWHRRDAGRTVNSGSFAESDCQWPRCIAPPNDRPAGLLAAARSRSSGSRARVAAQPRPTGNRPAALAIIRARTVTTDSYAARTSGLTSVRRVGRFLNN